MEIGYKFNVKEINKLSKFKNPSIVLKKDNIIKNGKLNFLNKKYV